MENYDELITRKYWDGLKAKEDLLDKQLILPQRLSVQSELANWFGKDFNKLHVSFTSNLGTNAGSLFEGN